MTSENRILIVDLDGTLLKSDLLYECFWSAFSKNWKIPFLAIYFLIKGKTYLKSFLNDQSCLNIKNLPYNEKVISYIIEFKKNNGKVALISASEHELVVNISKHLKIFDYAFGTRSNLNLKGINKLNFIQKQFPLTPFIYMGDNSSDLPIWIKADRAITVNASKNVRSKVEKLNPNYDHFFSEKKFFKRFLKAIRIRQWIKNILIFSPMIAAQNFDFFTFKNSLLAFLAFSFVASSVYVVNDLIDLDSDRDHPRKKNRQFASGSIPVNLGGKIAFLLLLCGFLIGTLTTKSFLLVLLVYYFLTLSYTLSLKNKYVVDIFTLSLLYSIRIFAGSVATNVSISFWFIAFSIFIFFSLACVKRQTEIVDIAKRNLSQIKGRAYIVNDLQIITTMAVTSGYLAVLVLALYINSPKVIELYTNPNALWFNLGILLLWISRTIFISHRGHMNDDPIVFAFKDKTSRTLLSINFLIVLIASIGW